MLAAALLLVLLAFSPSQDPLPFDQAVGAHTEELVARLRAPDARDREAAAMILSLAGPRAEAAVPALIQALDDGEPRVRAFAALALAKIAPSSELVRAALHLRLARDSEGIVRSSVAASLGEIANAGSVLPLTKALTDPDSRTRLEAVKALAAIDPSAARLAAPNVKSLTKDSDPQVRAEAISLLKRLNRK